MIGLDLLLRVGRNGGYSLGTNQRITKNRYAGVECVTHLLHTNLHNTLALTKNDWYQMVI